MRLAATLSMARAFSLWRFRWDIGPLKQPGAARPQEGIHPLLGPLPSSPGTSRQASHRSGNKSRDFGSCPAPALQDVASSTPHCSLASSGAWLGSLGRRCDALGIVLPVHHRQATSLMGVGANV